MEKDINEFKVTINGCSGIPVLENPKLEYGKQYDITLRVGLESQEETDKNKDNKFILNYKTKTILGIQKIRKLEEIEYVKKEDNEITKEE